MEQPVAAVPDKVPNPDRVHKRALLPSWLIQLALCTLCIAGSTIGLREYTENTGPTYLLDSNGNPIRDISSQNKEMQVFYALFVALSATTFLSVFLEAVLYYKKYLTSLLQLLIYIAKTTAWIALLAFSIVCANNANMPSLIVIVIAATIIIILAHLIYAVFAVRRVAKKRRKIANGIVDDPVPNDSYPYDGYSHELYQTTT